MQQTGELVQAMWTEVGFKVNYNLYDEAVLTEKRRSGDFHADSMAASYRFDPDGWFSRQVLSAAPYTKETSRFKNDKADKLILEARGLPISRSALRCMQRSIALSTKNSQCCIPTP